MKLSDTTKDVLTGSRFEVLELKRQVESILKRLGEQPGTIQNQKRLKKVLPVFDEYMST